MALLADLSDGLTDSIDSGGTTTVIANLPMNNFRHTGVGAATGRTHYAQAAQVQDGGLTYAAATDGGTDAYTASLSPAITAYVTGMVVRLKFNEANTTAAPTIALNGIASPKTIVRQSGDPLVPGDIDADGIYELVYTGTNFQLLSPTGGFWLANSITVQSTDAGAGAAPTLILYRDSATPAVSDLIGSLQFDGESSTGVTRTYVRVLTQINDPTNASEDATILLQTMVAGTLTTALQAAGVAVTLPGTLAVTGASVLTGAVTLTGGVTGAMAATGAVSGSNLLSSSYTPTLSNTTNVTASQAYLCIYSRVGNTVTVSGKFDVDPAVANTATLLGLSLPIASDLTVVQQCSGSAIAVGVATECAAIIGDTANNRASVTWTGTVSDTNHAVHFIFQYEIA